MQELEIHVLLPANSSQTFLFHYFREIVETRGTISVARALPLTGYGTSCVQICACVRVRACVCVRECACV